MIELIDFTKRELFVHYNLKIDKGINFFKGKNGSGKTTLFDCIAGLDRDYKGKIIGNANCVYLNQNLYFSGRLKSKDLIKFIYRLDGITNYEMYYNDRMSEYNTIFNFKDLWNKQISFLSGGELKLLFFSIISSLDKGIYIFDEPYSSVDNDGKLIITQILNVLAEQQKTILLSSHEEQFLDSVREAKIIDL